MGLQTELNLPHPFTNQAHVAAINIVLTGAYLSKEGDRILRQYGLTDAWFNVLTLLKRQAPEGRLRQADLGRMLVVNRSNVTGLVDRMESAGLVRRIPDPDDRRVNYVEMTEAGSAAIDRAEPEYYRRLDEIMVDLDDKDRMRISNLLEAVRERCRSEQDE